jgi:hypothetical protein
VLGAAEMVVLALVQHQPPALQTLAAAVVEIEMQVVE